MFRNFVSLLAVLCVVAFAAQAPAALVANWSMDETSGTSIADVTSNGYTGTLNGTGQTLGVPGAVGTAIDFPATSGTQMSVNGSVTGLNGVASGSSLAFSAAMWVNMPTTWSPTSGAQWYWMGTSPASSDLQISDANTRDYFVETGGLYVDYGGMNYGMNQLITAGKFTLGKWQLLSLTYTGTGTTGTLTSYINGVQIGTTTGASTGVPQLAGFDINYYGGIANFGVNDVSLWGNTLSGGQLTAMYNTPLFGGALAGYGTLNMSKLFNVYNTGTPQSVGAAHLEQGDRIARQRGQRWTTRRELLRRAGRIGRRCRDRHNSRAGHVGPVGCRSGRPALLRLAQTEVRTRATTCRTDFLIRPQGPDGLGNPSYS